MSTDESDPLGTLLIDAKAIAKAIRRRNKPYVVKTVRAKTKDLLQEKAEIESRDGWQVLRKRRKSYHMKQDKPISEQLEDSVWVTLARMGFDEMSDGRQFMVDLGEHTLLITAFAFAIGGSFSAQALVAFGAARITADTFRWRRHFLGDDLTEGKGSESHPNSEWMDS